MLIFGEYGKKKSERLPAANYQDSLTTNKVMRYSEDLNKAIGEARKSLLFAAEKLEHFVFPAGKSIRFVTNLLELKYIEDVLEDVPAAYSQGYQDTDFIYIVRLLNPDKHICTEMTKHFSLARKAQLEDNYKGKKDYCRLNQERNSDTLYVGRSKKLRSRFRQHLGSKNGGLFALHMERWATEMDAMVEIIFYQLDGYDNLFIQHLENGLWEYFRPMFGKKGEK